MNEKPKRFLGMIPLREERLAKKVLLASILMSFIPLLLIFSAFHTIIFPQLPTTDRDFLSTVLYAIIAISLAGYALTMRLVKSMLAVIEQAKQFSEGKKLTIDVQHEAAEIGELASAFNRITRELEQKISDLESSKELIRRLLERVGTAFASYDSVDTILELIVENLNVALEAKSVGLLLIDGERQELYLKASSDPAIKAMESPRVKVGDGFIGTVAAQGKPAIGSGVSDPFNREAQAGGHLACAPLLIRDRTLGVLYATRDTSWRAFTQDDLALLTSLCAQVAVSIENYRLNQDIENTYLETITALAMAVEAKDSFSFGHARRTAAYSEDVAKAMNLDVRQQRIIHDAAMLHDIGKIGIKDSILMKAGQLDSEERKIIEQHPAIGEAILKPVRSLAEVASLVRSHHERYDGEGYPDKIKGEDIPLASRILSVADAYDSITTDRPDRKRRSHDEAVAELRRHAGTQFDPQVVNVFIATLDGRRANANTARAD